MTASFSTPIMVVNKSDYYLLKSLEERVLINHVSHFTSSRVRILLRCWYMESGMQLLVTLITKG